MRRIPHVFRSAAPAAAEEAHAETARAETRRGDKKRAEAKPAEPDPGVVDLRGAWAAAGAWCAAALLVRVPVAQAAALAVAGCFLLALMAWNLRAGRGLVAWFHRAWTPVALAAAGATVVAASVAVQGLGGADPQVAVLVGERETARVRIVLLEAPEPRPAAPGFDPSGPDSRSVDWVAEGRLQALAVSGTWVSSGARVVVSWAADSGVAGSRVDAAGTEGTGALGTGTAGVAAGDTVEALGRLSPVAAGRREVAWVRLRSPPTVTAVPPDAVDRAREASAALAGVLPGDGPALLPGMVMGDRSGQDAGLEASMTRAGLAHLTAVSGANCALVLGGVLGAARSCRLGRTAALLLCLAALAGFVAVVHPEPSVVRAASMGAVSALAVYAGRGRQAVAALCACVVGLLVWDPWYAGEAAFRLSVAATAGIALAGRPLAVVLRRVLPGWLADGTAITVSAQVFCLPVLLTFTTDVATYAVPANLAVAPLVPLTTLAGTAALGLVFLPVAPALATGLVWVAGLPAALVGILGRWFAGLPHAHLAWAEGPAGVAAAVAVAAALVASLWMLRLPDGEPGRRSVKPLAVLLAVIAVAGSAGITLPATALFGRDPPAWDVALCDVGQGDALALRTGQGRAVVIDTGPDPEPVRSCLDLLGVRVVDVLMLTHLHADHIGGVEGVFAGREVQRMLYSTAVVGPDGEPEGEPDGVPAELSERLPATAAPRRAFAGERGSAGPVAWEVLWPVAGSPAATENDASLVVKFRIGTEGNPSGRAVTLLATGDIEEVAMGALLRGGADMQADILKVSHHGARNGGTAAIDAADPLAALVGVGAGNSYGHPAPETLAALEAAGAAVFRTDTTGAVVLRRDGDALVPVRVQGPDGQAP